MVSWIESAVLLFDSSHFHFLVSISSWSLCSKLYFPIRVRLWGHRVLTDNLNNEITTNYSRGRRRPIQFRVFIWGLFLRQRLSHVLIDWSMSGSVLSSCACSWTWTHILRVCSNRVSWDVSISSLFPLYTTETIWDLVYFSSSGSLRPGVLISWYPSPLSSQSICRKIPQQTLWPAEYSFSFRFLPCKVLSQAVAIHWDPAYYWTGVQYRTHNWSDLWVLTCLII